MTSTPPDAASGDDGAFAPETGVLSYQHDSANGEPTTVRTWTIGNDATFRLGLLSDVDVQVQFPLYGREETERDRGGTTIGDGFGDVVVGLRANVWGNDAGATALGLLAFVQIPTGTELGSTRGQGGLAVPFAWTFAETWELTLMPQLEAVPDSEEGGHDVELLFAASMSFEIHGPLDGFVECAGTASSDGPYDASFNTGLALTVSPDLVLDAGVEIGLTRAATDLTAFVGLSVRF